MPFADLLISCFVDSLIACLIVVPLPAMPSSIFTFAVFTTIHNNSFYTSNFQKKDKQFFDTGLEKEKPERNFLILTFCNQKKLTAVNSLSYL
jgi:hypothetical protein